MSSHVENLVVQSSPAIYIRCARGGCDAFKSLAKQRKLCLDFLARCSDEDVPVEPRVYCDIGSGIGTNHTGLTDLLTDAQAGRISLLVVPGLDRLSRDSPKLGHIINSLVESGVVLRSADGVFDSSSAVGTFMTSLLSVFA